MTETTARIGTDRGHALEMPRVRPATHRPKGTAISPESVTIEMMIAINDVVSEMTADVIAMTVLDGPARVIERRTAGIGAMTDGATNARLLAVGTATEDGSVTKTANAGGEEIVLGMMKRPIVAANETRTRIVGTMIVKHGPSGAGVSGGGPVVQMTLETKRIARTRTRIRHLRGWKPMSRLAVVEAF